jgi:hypothetical protein
MTERPILFSAPMVKAILAGTKTQTRRVLKPQPMADGYYEGEVRCQNVPAGARFVATAVGGAAIRTDFAEHRFAPGDTLWVREAFIPDAPVDDDAWSWDTAPMSGTEWVGCGRPIYAVPEKFRTPDHVIYKADPKWSDCENWRWRPSIHMPRWASRITLRVTAVKVERLCSISDEDVKAEGIRQTLNGSWSAVDNYPPMAANTPVGGFYRLWTSISGAASWEANPWVSCISFERVK